MSEEIRFAEQRDTLERLRDEMEQAKALYDGARDAYLQEQKRYPDPAAPVLAHAMLVFDFSRESYKFALRRFNRLVIDGQMPRAAKAATLH